MSIGTIWATGTWQSASWQTGVWANLGSPDFAWVTGPTSLSALTHAIKQNDTEPSYLTQLLGSDGTVQSVSGATAVFSMRQLGAPTATVSRGSMEVDDADTNTVRYDFAADDTLVAGVYQYEVELTGPDGKVMTFPNDGYGLLTVTPEIA